MSTAIQMSSIRYKFTALPSTRSIVSKSKFKDEDLEAGFQTEMTLK